MKLSAQSKIIPPPPYPKKELPDIRNSPHVGTIVCNYPSCATPAFKFKIGVRILGMQYGMQCAENNTFGSTFLTHRTKIRKSETTFTK